MPAAILAFLFLPLPHSIICPLEIQPRDANSVYVIVPGTLLARPTSKAGDQVDKRPAVGTAPRPRPRSASRQARKAASTRMKRSWRAFCNRVSTDHHAADQIPEIQEAIDALKKQLAQKTDDQKRLLLTAPSAGTVLPPPLTPRRDDPDEKLATWSGTPLDPENVGAHLDRDTLFCQIGDPTKLEAVMVIDQADRNLILDGRASAVDIKLQGFAAPARPSTRTSPRLPNPSSRSPRSGSRPNRKANCQLKPTRKPAWRGP